MIYNKYTRYTTEELLKEAFNDPQVDDLALELALRLQGVSDAWDMDQDETQNLHELISELEENVRELEENVRELDDRLQQATADV